MRYKQLNDIIAANKPSRIVEVGTWTGDRAIQMATEALKHQDKVHYTGFDLFEEATPENDKAELNVKRHAPLEEAREKLEAFREKNPAFTFNLVKGNTKETLPEYDFVAPVDLAFIDGGHSVETIRSDYENLSHAEVIVFDDYYTDRDTDEFGCNKIVENLDFMLLPKKDPVVDGGFVQMAQVGGQMPKGKQSLVVKTKNCVPDEEIQNNIKYFLSKNIKMIPQCNVHDKVAVFVNGGPDFRNYTKELKQIQSEGAYLIAVKHAYDYLLNEGIVPWGMSLLDPRDHVQKFLDNIRPDVKYITASQVHPTTLDKLLEAGADIYGYHASVGAGEDKIIQDGFLVGGGSTSAMRGMSVMYTLGFRKFLLYGFDCCYWPWEEMDTSKTDDQGKPKYFECEVNGRWFLTDSENIAQAQDFEKAWKVLKGAEIVVRGDGMIPHIWSNLREKKANFDDVFREAEKAA